MHPSVHLLAISESIAEIHQKLTFAPYWTNFAPVALKWRKIGEICDFRPWHKITIFIAIKTRWRASLKGFTYIIVLQLRKWNKNNWNWCFQTIIWKTFHFIVKEKCRLDWFRLHCHVSWTPVSIEFSINLSVQWLNFPNATAFMGKLFCCDRLMKCQTWLH